MFNTRYFANQVLFVTAIVCALAVGRPFAAADEDDSADLRQRQLIEVLLSDAPPQNKAMTCKQLALYGNREAVTALAPLLADKQLASWARIALEVIPGPEADDALREAAGKLTGSLAVGAINSLAVRRDTRSVATLVKRLNDPDAEIAAAAAVALGRIGNGPATDTLEQALTTVPPGVRSAVAEGCILAAERRLAEDNVAEAVRLYDVVRKADVPKQRILEATRGAILARGNAGVSLLAEQLQSSDKDTFDIGLRAARELDASEVTTTLMTELERATPERRALLILTLVDLNDVAALPAMIKAAGGGEVQTRIAAIQMLGRLGDGSCVPVLLDAALESDQRLSRAALEMLVALPDKKVDADLAARLAKAEGAARRVLIELAGRRQITAAVPILLKAADDTDIEIRAAALTALGYTVELRDLTVLIARVANPPKTIEEARAAEAALRAACQRMPDREACAERLVIAMSQSSVAAKCRFLETLTVMGGERALQAVGVAARDTDPELQDTGSRLLGEWIGPDAAPVLLDLTKTAKQEKYKIRALRGYIRLARQFEMPPRQRAEMCRTALDFARRDEERKLVLEVLERYPNSDTLGIAVQASKLPTLKSDAMRTALVIAEQIGEPADLVRVLAEHGQKPMKIEIIKAEYGAGARRKDVTEILQKYVRGYPLITLPSPKYNDSFDGDPAGGVVKQLTVRYRIDGKAAEASFQENDKIVLPVPE